MYLAGCDRHAVGNPVASVVNPWLTVAIAAIALAAIIFVPVVRRVVGAMVGFGGAFVAIAIAIGGTAILINDVSISDSPGPSARVWRFLTMDSAATSTDGQSSAECARGWEGAGSGAPANAASSGASKEAEPRRGKSRRARAESGKMAPATPVAIPAGASQEADADDYPELVRRGYPGIPPSRLFQLAQQTVNELGGWKISSADAARATLDCVYTTRIFRFEDEVRIVVTPKSEIDLCSRSRIGAPGSVSWLRFFPGDFGANIGHVKQFYQALEPRVDAVYKEQEDKGNR